MQMWGLSNMYVEILIVGIALFLMMSASDLINLNRFVIDSEALFRKIKESDWDFLVKARYGNNASPDVLYNTRIKNWIIISLLLIVVFLFTGISIIKIVVAFAVAYGAFKLKYLDLSSWNTNKVTSMGYMFYQCSNLETIYTST